MSRLSEEQISAQESLTLDRFNFLNKVDQLGYIDRPTDSLIELINWSRSIINTKLIDKRLSPVDFISFIHNKICIDGSFVQFCTENNVKIETVFTDAITSWKSDYDDEHFVATGIFNIISGDLSFYHCGLFHKGNQNEDEVSFFVLINPQDYESYIAFRNKYEDWQTKRERNSQEIEVIGGNSIPYDPTLTWDSVYLPDDLKNNILLSVDGFLKSKDIYEKLKVPWRRGLGFWGPRGVGKTSCLRVIMAQYPDLKPVTIQPGHQNPDELLEEAFAYAEDHSPALLFFEDLQELIKTIDMRHFLQLLDGLQKMDGILTIVTGNDFSALEENLKSRPRRFDRFFEFKLPDLEQSIKYLNKHFVDILSSRKIESIAKKAVKNKLTYSHLQEIYINSAFIAIPDGREVPAANHVDQSFEQILKEKKDADSDFLAKKRSLTDDLDDEEEEE